MIFARTALSAILLALSCPTQGQNSAVSKMPGTQSDELLLFENRSEFFNVGTNVELACFNKTQAAMTFTIWRLSMERTTCNLGTNYRGDDVNTCDKRKALYSSTNNESFLHISNFTDTDTGVYYCETVYRDGSYSARINVFTTASPQISSRVDEYHSTRVAVCFAAGGKPAASISWRTTWNSSVTQSSILNSDGSYTVESHLVLPDHISTDNLTCDVMHPSWRGEHCHRLQVMSHGKSTFRTAFQYSVLAVCSAILLFGVLAAGCILRTPVRNYRQGTRRVLSHSPSLREKHHQPNITASQHGTGQG